MNTNWNGKGLPPIGITVRIPDDMACGNVFLWQFEGMTVEIVGHTTSRLGSDLAIFRYFEGEDCPRYHALAADNGNFEPIRTPEQIAAEQADREIDAICYDIVSHYENPKGSEHYLGLARALHLAGYRKQEQPK